MIIFNTQKEFFEVLEPYINHEIVQKMKNEYAHNKQISRFEHSLYVAYIAFLICKKLKLNASSAAIGGLLHDVGIKYGLSSAKDKLLDFFCHPKQSENLLLEHFDISDMERNIINTHMWPVTITKPPKYAESFMVNIADKYCASVEFLGVYKANIGLALKFSSNYLLPQK